MVYLVQMCEISECSKSQQEESQTLGIQQQ